MELTAEKRHELLIGDAERKTRNLPCFGFADATGAPDWAQCRILEIRGALVENRSIPAPSPEYLAGCEQRSAVASAALRTVTHLFPTKTKRPAAAPTSEDAVLRAIANRQGALVRQDALVLARARRDAEEKRAAEELAESVAAFNAATFPWERN